MSRTKTFLKKQIAFIGSGAMAEAMIGGLLERKISSGRSIVAAGPRSERGADLKSRYGIQCVTSNAAAIRGAELIVLSVKPQSVTDVLRDIRKRIHPKSIVVSIAAGVSLRVIADGLSHRYVVRAMPNTPARVGQGITVWTSSADVNDKQREIVALLFQACGEEIFVGEESYLDMATAISGNGPAYVCLFVEALIDAGVHLGFPRHIAERLVLQTIRGSVEYISRSPKHVAGLRSEVTSPGGTSAEALYYLERAGFRSALARAVWAGFERSAQLGRGERRQRLGDS